MLPSLRQFLIYAAIIIAASSVLTQFGDIISHRTKLGGLLVGTILIAGATSLPELAVDVNAVRRRAGSSSGDLMGSSLFNLLILVVLDLTRYSHGRMLSETSARHALAASVSIALTAIAAIFIQLGDNLDSLTFLRIGPGSVALVAAYALGIRLIFDTRGNNEEPSGKEKPTSWIPWAGKLKLRGAIIGDRPDRTLPPGGVPAPVCHLLCAATALCTGGGRGATAPRDRRDQQRVALNPGDTIRRIRPAYHVRRYD